MEYLSRIPTTSFLSFPRSVLLAIIDIDRALPESKRVLNPHIPVISTQKSLLQTRSGHRIRLLQVVPEGKAKLIVQTTRINNLQALLLDLLWQHRELALPPIPISQPHHFPLHLLPSRATEEKPGAHAGYEKLLSRFFSANAGLKADEESGEMEGEVEGMEGVEPDVGLVHWAEELLDLVSFSFLSTKTTYLRAGESVAEEISGRRRGIDGN